MQFSSKLLEEAVLEIAKLPGIGKKTALRLAFHLLRQGKEKTLELSSTLTRLRTEIIYCKKCHNIADQEICSICDSPRRDQHILCVVESPQDILAIENTAQYNGLYHVLGGVISPLEGVGPEGLNIMSLLERFKDEGGISELILALSPTMEGDTTAFYITKKLKDTPVKISTIARGIPIGGELEYTDEVTLGRSIINRVQYEFDR